MKMICEFYFQLLVISNSVVEQSGVRVIVDPQSMELLDGAMVDYEEELIRSGFRIAKNPQAEKGCSCGSSFTLRLD